MFDLTSRRNDRGVNPLSSLSSLQTEMRDFFDRFSREVTPFSDDSDFTPKVDVKDLGSSYEVRVEIPGMDEKDINVTFRDNTLILEGEKKNESKQEEKGFVRSEITYGSFYRAVPFSNEVDADKISANYKHGVLWLTLEKLPETHAKAKRISISGASGKKDKLESKH